MNGSLVFFGGYDILLSYFWELFHQLKFSDPDFSQTRIFFSTPIGAVVVPYF